MRYTITIECDSRYGEKTVGDMLDIKDKVESWVKGIVEENNSGNRHLGLHVRMSEYDVHVVDLHKLIRSQEGPSDL